ncbi:MAG: hypothetical protein AAF617_09330 [Bacteroidota bacterium]
MKYLKHCIAIVILALTWSCNNDDDATTTTNPPIYENRIDIEEYAFYFPDDFRLEPLQGIDSYIGNINGNEITLFFDYGWYTRPSENLSPSEFDVSEDIINGYYRQIVKPIDPAAHSTKIHLFNVSERDNSPNGYNSLTVSTNNLTQAQQEVIMNVFTTVQFIN